MFFMIDKWKLSIQKFVDESKISYKLQVLYVHIQAIEINENATQWNGKRNRNYPFYKTTLIYDQQSIFWKVTEVVAPWKAFSQQIGT